MSFNTDVIKEFCARGTEMINKYDEASFKELPFKVILYPDYGKKRVRIVRAELWSNEDNPTNRSAWAFIDMDGNVFKSASWAAPAKHARANIYTDDNMGFGTKIGPYGPAYLR
jgi:hypothetical protein